MLLSSFISPPETSNQFVREQFADTTKLADALLILLTSRLTELNQQKTLNSFSVG